MVERSSFSLLNHANIFEKLSVRRCHVISWFQPASDCAYPAPVLNFPIFASMVLIRGCEYVGASYL